MIKNLFKVYAECIKLYIKSILSRITEFLLNILDLLHGDQMKVVAVKKAKDKS